VVHWFEHPRTKGDLAEIANTTGYAPHEAQFVVRLDEYNRPTLHRLHPAAPEPEGPVTEDSTPP
jgi:hypothetical protein